MTDRVEAVGIGSIFIDDIVLPDGTTHMRQLGGGVIHALMGMASWDERPGLVALAGQDLPQTTRSVICQYLDTQGLHFLDIPQIRAWQLCEADGTRRELYRVAITEPFIKGAQPHHLPDDYGTSRAYYLLQDFEGIQAWCQAVEGIVLWEPLQQIMQPGALPELRRCLRTCDIDIVSPNLDEAQAVYGPLSPDSLVNALLEDGAQIVALRMGAEGSLIASPQERFHIPAVPVEHVIDPTGAGNTYCGAFLVGWLRRSHLREAAFMAAVAASFCIEQIGVIDPGKVQLSERDRRYQQLAAD